VQPIDDNTGEWFQFAGLTAVPFREFAGWIETAAPLEYLLKRREDRFAITHQARKLEVDN
jgi:hypothetical protein